MNLESQNRAASWGETLLALGPILLFLFLYGIGAILTNFLYDLINPTFGIGILLAIAAALLIVLTVGLVKDFPRWVFPYWGFVLLITLYFSSFSGTVFSLPFTGGLLVWLPVGLVIATGLLWTHSLRPLRSLTQSIWKDWTLLSFAFYGALPLLSFAAYDETQNQAWTHILILLLLGIGSVFYMRLENHWRRFASLIGGFTVGWLVLMINLSWYWHGRQEYWMQEPGTWIETLNWTGRFGAILMGILAAPVGIEFIRRAFNTKPESPSPQVPGGN